MLRKIVGYTLAVISCLIFGVADAVLFGILRLIILAIASTYAVMLVKKGGSKEDIQKVETVYFFLTEPLLYTPLYYISVVACYMVNLVLCGDNAMTMYEVIIAFGQSVQNDVLNPIHEMFDDMI